MNPLRRLLPACIMLLVIAEAAIRDITGALVLAIRKGDGSFNLQPQASSGIEQGDVFVVIGTQEQLGLLEKMVQ